METSIVEEIHTTALERHPASLYRIRFQDCDPFGHLNNGRYLDYIINAREEHLLQHYDLDLYSERFRDFNWVARSSRVNHLVPLRPNRMVRIQTGLLNFTRSQLLMEAVLTEPDSRTLHATGWVEFIHVDTRTGRPARHAPELMELFQLISLNVEFSFAEDRTRVNAIKKALR